MDGGSHNLRKHCMGCLGMGWETFLVMCPWASAVCSGSTAAFKATSTAHLCGDSSIRLHWQPCTAATDSRWLLVGRKALESRSMTSMVLGDKGLRAIWIYWCGDGVHAVLLQPTHSGQQISVWHVPSGMKRKCLDCAGIPTLGDEPSADTYVSLGAHRVLVPVTVQSVTLCSLPSLAQTGRFEGSEAAVEPSFLVCMGWAANGSLIAVVWLTSDCRGAVTVHSGFDLSLYRTIYLGDPDKDKSFQAFAACPDQPTAAVAWSSDDVHDTTLLNLDAGTTFALQHGAEEEPASSARVTDIFWGPKGKHLVVRQGGDCAIPDWNIFAIPSGRWCAGGPGLYSFHDPPVWTSEGDLCLTEGTVTLLDLSADQPVDVAYYRKEPIAEPDWSPSRCSFAPVTQNVVILQDDLHVDSPISHWVYDVSTGSSERHPVSGLGQHLARWYSNINMAWHPTLKSVPVYALTEDNNRAAVHLIDAQKHCLLITWSSSELAGILQEASCVGSASIAWSPDGKRLAIVNLSGTIIIDLGQLQGA